MLQRMQPHPLQKFNNYPIILLLLLLLPVVKG